MPSKLPQKYSCLACLDTKKDSRGNDCFPCSIKRKIERPDSRPTISHEPTVKREKSKSKPKLKPRTLPPKKS